MVDVKQILSQMTTEEKIGQLMQHNANMFIDSSAAVTGDNSNKLGLSQEVINTVGSVLNFCSSVEMRTIQDMHLKNDRNKIPMLFMMDVVHGFRTIFPIPLTLGCSFDPNLAARCSEMAADEATAGGVQVTFTPMVDYVRDARWGRVMETCGEEPLLNGMMGAAQIRAFRGKSLSDKTSMATCVKHFAAYGGAEAGRDYNTVELSEHILREYYLPAYKACIDAGADMIMPAFNTLNGIPATVNFWLMKKVLKEEWGFSGIVISDFNAIGDLERHGITNDEKTAARLAFENGCDIEMVSNTYTHCLKELIEKGVFTEEQLDDAVLKVLNLKNNLGMFEDPYHGADIQENSERFLTPEHRATARKAAEECAVLLKNDGILPLSPQVEKIALIGPFADNHEIIGFWSCNGKNEESVTVSEGIHAAAPNTEITVTRGCGNLYDDCDRSGFDAAVKAAAAADVVILCLGEPQNYSGEGNSRADITLTGLQDELAAAVANANKNIVALTFSGRPLALTELEKNVRAILHMWFPGTEGGSAAANLLFGYANPCGKLSMTFPRAVGQCPIYYNHTNTGKPKFFPDDKHQPYASNYIDCPNSPLFPFGHGLSYSNFKYENLELSDDVLYNNSNIEVSVTVKNCSDTVGKETVMLYMRDLFASNSRPVQQLIAFEKAEFAADETKTFKFNITAPMLGFWNNENKFVAEDGVFQISTGCADRLILTKSFTLISNAE